jgi:glycosyltransferase involved in cell wall biosynthesis
VLSRHPEWRLEIAGFGGDEELIKQKAQSLPNVYWHGRVDYGAAMALNQKGTTLIATYDPSIPNHRFSSPNKVFEAMMLGKPIIVAKCTNMDEIIQQANCGIVINYGNENELEDALTQLSSDPETCQKLGANGRHAYETQYSWTIMSSRLVNLYKNLENGKR